MLKMIITEAVVSKGYDGAPAIRFYDGDGSSQIANFRIGKRAHPAHEAQGGLVHQPHRPL